jgi:hypothetical protein
MEWLIFAVAWFIFGWVPSRIHKHYVLNRFGPDYWSDLDEGLHLFLAFLGVMMLVAFLFARWRFDVYYKEDYGNIIPWGWCW